MSDQHERQHEPFSDIALSEANDIDERVSEAVLERTEVQGIAIDDVSAKDLDDAFWLEKMPQGGYLLSISIVDVGSFITPHTTPTIDSEARTRAFTRYSAEKVVMPLLPQKVSQGKMSLLEDQLCPTLTLTIPLDTHLSLGEPSIHATAVRSKRLTYEEVDHEIEHLQTEFAQLLRDAFHLAQRLWHQRRAKGAFALYDLFSGWVTTEEGVLFSLAQEKRHKAHIIVQEFMILANQVLALFLAERNLPALYRNHTAKALVPERSALLTLLETVEKYPQQITPEHIQTTVNLVLERAIYAPTIVGHFGLNLPVYIHATSPLRRYSDIVNQRVLLAALLGEPTPYTKTELETIAVHLNEEEAIIKEAKKVYFLAEYDELLRNMVDDVTQIQQLDTKQFHSVIRMAAESHVLPLIVEQEILRRLEAHLLKANDLFTLVFRYQNSGEEWREVKTAVLHSLQKYPSDAITLLTMGQQERIWDAPYYEEMTESRVSFHLFHARVSVQVKGQSYTSSFHIAPQKKLAKQYASVEVLASIAGVTLSATASEL